MRIPRGVFLALCGGIGLGVGQHFGLPLGFAAFCAATLVWLLRVISWSEPGSVMT